MTDFHQYVQCVVDLLNIKEHHGPGWEAATLDAQQRMSELWRRLSPPEQELMNRLGEALNSAEAL